MQLATAVVWVLVHSTRRNLRSRCLWRMHWFQSLDCRRRTNHLSPSLAYQCTRWYKDNTVAWVVEEAWVWETWVMVAVQVEVAVVGWWVRVVGAAVRQTARLEASTVAEAMAQAVRRADEATEIVQA